MQTKSLNEKEKKVLQGFLEAMQAIKPTRKIGPVVIAMVGLVGSGKSTIARELADRLHAVIIRTDEIRGALRKVHAESLASVEVIASCLAREALLRRVNIVLDADVVTTEKKKQVERLVESFDAKLWYVRTVAEPDVMFTRAIAADYRDPFHAVFDSPIVKIREIWRRTPHHYRWSATGGGHWELKTLSHEPLIVIETTDEKKLRREVVGLAKKILSG